MNNNLMNEFKKTKVFMISLGFSLIFLTISLGSFFVLFEGNKSNLMIIIFGISNIIFGFSISTFLKYWKMEMK